MGRATPAADGSAAPMEYADPDTRFLGDRAQVALWGRNLADETYFTAALPLAGILGTMTRSYAPPRLWGAELTYAF